MSTRPRKRAAASLPKRAAAMAAIAAIPVIDMPLPIYAYRPRFEPPGNGPWQRKAMAMKPGQSIVVTQAQADAFRGACRRLGIEVRRCTIGRDRVQVQIVSKPEHFS